MSPKSHCLSAWRTFQAGVQGWKTQTELKVIGVQEMRANKDYTENLEGQANL